MSRRGSLYAVLALAWLLAASAAAQAPADSAAAADRSGASGPGDKPVRIYKIKLEGCGTLAHRGKVPCATIRSILRIKPTPFYRLWPKEGGYDEFFAQEEEGRIQLFYQSRGYYQAEVVMAPPRAAKFGRGMIISYKIVEGEATRVARIGATIVDNPDDADELEDMKALIGFKVGDVFALGPYQKAAKAMEADYKDNGHYRVKVERRAVVDPTKLTAEVDYAITRGAHYQVGEITVTGANQTGESVPRKAFKTKEGDRYHRDVLLEDQRRAQSMPIYQAVRIDEQPNDESKTVDLSIRILETKPQRIKLGLGFGSEEGFRVQTAYQHVNFFGGARQLSLAARWSSLLEREEISVIQPNVRTPGDYIMLAARHEFEHEDSYDHEAISLSPTYHFILTDYLQMDLNYVLEINQSSNIVDVSKVKADDLAREGLRSAVLLRLDWKDLDRIIDPTRGARASLSAELAGGPLGGVFPYYRLIGEARGYYPLYPFGEAAKHSPDRPLLIGAIMGRIGWAAPFGDLNLIPSFERFYSGGAGSVRGFERRKLGPLDKSGDPIGGSKMMEGSVELRFPLIGDLGGVVFLDGGWVWLESEPLNPADALYAAGFGLRWNTPIGPVSFDLGFPLSGLDQYPPSQFSVSIGQAF